MLGCKATDGQSTNLICLFIPKKNTILIGFFLLANFTLKNSLNVLGTKSIKTNLNTKSNFILPLSIPSLPSESAKNIDL
jgi:hypothetical protein